MEVTILFFLADINLKMRVVGNYYVRQKLFKITIITWVAIIRP